jgi:iron(III) transport system substrate-binding protein
MCRLSLSRLGVVHVLVGLLLAATACAPQASAPPPTTAPPKPTTAPAAPTTAPQSAATSAPKPTAASQATPAATSVPQAQGTAEKPAASAPAASGAEWDDLVQAAKKEGELVIFLGRAGSRQLRDAFPAFQQKYGIKVTQVAGSGNENADKVLAERDTGIYTADIWMGGLTTINTRLLPKKVFEPIEAQFVLPEVKDKAAWMKGQFWWGDPDKQFTFLFSASPSPLISYNTNLVKPEEIKSFYDLLDPKWKGKIVSRDPTSAGTGGNTVYFYFHPQLGKEFLRRLFTEQDITVVDDARQATEWLALGKYSLYLLGSGSDVSDAQDQGLPVKDNYGPFKEGARIAAGGTGSLSMFNKAAHPNAAKLFVNWWLSKEGQLVAQKADPLDQSLRIDIPNDAITPETRRVPGVEYSFLDSQPEIVSSEGEMLTFMKQVLGR